MPSDQRPTHLKLESLPDPEDDDVWQAARENAEEIVVTSVREELPDRDRTLWYCPTVSLFDAYRAKKLFERYGIERVYDLGAGDCRFSLWLAERGYDVVAYELNEELVAGVRDRFDLDDMELRKRDYYDDFGELAGSDTAVVCFGGTNELPHVPDVGLAIEGYCEIGITAWYDGEVIATW